MTITLYHYWRSSSSWRVRWALSAKGIAFESVAVNLLEGAQHTPEHRARNPMGYVPALVLPDARVLAESVAICEYLEDTTPTPSLRPTDPFLRARMRQLVEIVCSDTQPVQNLFVLKAVSEDKKKQGEWARLFVERGLGAFERVLETTRREGVAGRFAMGDELTLADLFLVPQLYNARRFHVELGAFPRCVDIEAAAKETDSYRASCPDAWEPK